MAVEIRAFTLVIPAGTTAANPVVQDVSFPPRVVDDLQVVVPPGPSGVVGWCVMNSGVRVIPYQSDLWVVTAGEFITWPLTGQITSGSWQVAGYNTGLLDHNVYFRFLLSLITSATDKSRPDIIDVADVNSLAPGGSTLTGG